MRCSYHTVKGLCSGISRSCTCQPCLQNTFALNVSPFTCSSTLYFWGSNWPLLSSGRPSLKTPAPLPAMALLPPLTTVICLTCRRWPQTASGCIKKNAFPNLYPHFSFGTHADWAVREPRLLNTKEINKVLLYSTENHIQYPVINHKEDEYTYRNLSQWKLTEPRKATML